NAVSYSFESPRVDINGNISIINADYQSLEFANSPLQCGANTYQEGGFRIGNDGGSSSSSSSSSSSVSSSSSSSSSVNVGDCSVPSGVQLIAPMFSWQQYTGSITVPLSGNGTTVSFPVTTGSRLGAAGGMSGGELSWTAGVIRKMWISECPGGAPVSLLCNRESTAAFGINWVQGTGRGMCELQRNKQYYVNMKNVFDPVNTANNCVTG